MNSERNAISWKATVRKLWIWCDTNKMREDQVGSDILSWSCITIHLLVIKLFAHREIKDKQILVNTGVEGLVLLCKRPPLNV